MLNFSTFLSEAMKSTAETTAKRTHLEHSEDLAFDGHDSVAQAENHLREFHKALLGKKSAVKTSTKYDGAPAIHVGMDEDGNHFVATKSVFNKNPKMYKTEADVDKDYPPDHPLNNIIKKAVRHLPDTMPRDMKPGEMYKGDILGVQGGDRQPKVEKGFVTTQPNVIKYKYPKDSQEGRELADSQIGVVWHTKFNKKGEADSMSDKDQAKFSRSKDVFTANPEVKANPANYTPQEQADFENHMENARREYGRIKPDVYDRLAGHNDTLRTYINQTVRTGEEPNYQGYMGHLVGRQQKDVDSVKTPAAKDRKIQQHSAFMQQAAGNQKDVESLLRLHSHLQNAKNVLVGVADKNSPSANELPNGESYGHEGYVTTDRDGGAVKMVNRPKFSRMLLTGQGNIGKAPAAAPAAPAAPITEEVAPKRSVWVMPGRFQPVHSGHVQGAMDSAAAAQKAGAEFQVLATHTHNRDNPLTPEQKMEHLRTAMPGINIQQTSPEFPSILHHASRLYDQGVTDLTVVGGPERESGHLQVLQKYDGVRGPHGYYKLNSINSGSTGERDPDAEGPVGASGSAMKKHAEDNNFPKFASMASPFQSTEQKQKMFDDIKDGQAKFPPKKTRALAEDADEDERRAFMMKPENQKDNAFTAGLKKYTPIGDIDQIGNALYKGKIKDAILPAAQLATNLIPGRALATAASAGVGVARGLKENSTGSVGGLGFNTGVPSVTDNHIANYVEASTADADTRDNVLKGMINKSTSPETHEKIGFKAFDPSKDLKSAKGGK